MRNKVIPLFIFFGLGKLQDIKASSLPLGSTSENASSLPLATSEHSSLSSYVLAEQSPIDSASCQSTTEANQGVILSRSNQPTDEVPPEKSEEGSVMGSSYPDESNATSILPNILHRSFKKMITPLIESDNGDKANQIRKNNSRFFDENESIKLGISDSNEKTQISMLEIYESENIYPLANRMYSIPFNMIMTDDFILGKIFLYNLEENKIESRLERGFIDKEIPGIEALTKSAMHLISLYRFELSPCEVYAKFIHKDKYYKSFIVARNQKAYLLTHSGAEELDQNPIIAEEEMASNQPIYLFSINLCGDIYKGSDKLQFQNEEPLIDDNLIAKGVEILSLLSCACHTKLKSEKGIEFGRGSILKKLPIVGPLSFFVENQDLKTNLINSLKDFWTKKTKKPTKTIHDFSKFLKNPDAFEITEPNFENIAQEAINKLKILFPQVIKEDGFSETANNDTLTVRSTPTESNSSMGRIGSMLRLQTKTGDRQ